jgi:hypothetical protein
MIYRLFLEGDPSCSLTDLVYVSGADHVPPLGFKNIVFIHTEGRCLPTASACDIQLRLPTIHGSNYQRFKEMMVMALKSHDGFGGV